MLLYLRLPAGVLKVEFLLLSGTSMLICYLFSINFLGNLKNLFINFFSFPEVIEK